MRRLLMSGDVERVIGTWEGSIRRVPYRETMAPLLKATAYASYGWIEAGAAGARARRARARVGRGDRAAALRRDAPRHVRGRSRCRAAQSRRRSSRCPCPPRGCSRAAASRSSAAGSRRWRALSRMRAARETLGSGAGGRRLAARPLGDALRRGDRRGRPRPGRETCRRCSRAPRLARPERFSHVPPRAPGAGVTCIRR